MRASGLLAMARGQAEALVPLLRQVMGEARCDLQDLTALGVGVGPGNFTGTRIAVSTARGLSLALGRPAVSVSSFDLMRDDADLGGEAAELVSVPAPREMAYVRTYRFGVPQADPQLIDPAAPPFVMRVPGPMCVTGYRAAEIARAFDVPYREGPDEALPWRLGIVTHFKWRTGAAVGRPAPLYVRPPEAAPPTDPPPRLIP